MILGFSTTFAVHQAAAMHLKNVQAVTQILLFAELSARIWHQISWLDPLLRTMLAEMCFKNLQASLGSVIPATCKSKALLKDTLL